MTRFRYEYLADQRETKYNGQWLNLDIPVVVFAGDGEEARERALSSLSKPRKDTNGWQMFLKRVEEIPDEAPPPLTPARRPSVRYRNRA